MGRNAISSRLDEHPGFRDRTRSIVHEDRHVRNPDEPQYLPSYAAHPFQTTVAGDDDDLRVREELHRRPRLQFR